MKDKTVGNDLQLVVIVPSAFKLTIFTDFGLIIWKKLTEPWENGCHIHWYNKFL